MNMNETHSAVCYIFREGAFSPVREAKSFQNEFGLDLFQYKGAIYEGRTGLCLCNLQQSQDLSGFMERHGGLESIEKQITNSLGRTGLSPRYTRPNEKKKDIFPPKERDENRVFSKDLMGKRHYYYRFYNENGIELYTLEISVIHGRRSLSLRRLYGGHRPAEPAGGSPEVAVHAGTRYPG